ncbi:uncharacterized protein F4807DRAFT_472922 [Annulohypoxylon truncatum]|uniref:uncharacterized protein n=1 Tax=Annulohypoxylon truncatum TaxID=327061 RepID=UPI00200751B8|nr:uncharacterized protein F4807DRAFT_472922 [Annulohypoxylon truncatum]KAI1204063.1 hypothetical protein F4807DRAFT_472922 [Annulohypoxylon truncatum]
MIEANTIIHPRIMAKDYEVHKFVVTFYPDSPDDMPRPLKDFKVGNTIAIFYTLVHSFRDRTIGYRIEHSDEVTVDHTPQAVRGFRNEQVIKYTPAIDTPRKCHNYDEAKDKPLKCGRCESAYYYSKECQVTGWNDKNHKGFCKALKDKSVKRMHFLKYEDYDGRISFS